MPSTTRATQPVCSSNANGLAKMISARPEMISPRKKIKNPYPSTVAHAYRRVKRFAQAKVSDDVHKDTAEGALVQRDSAARTRVVLNQEKREEKHARAADAQNPIDVDVGQGCCLRLQSGIEPGHRLPLRFVQTQSRVGEPVCEAVESSLELWISWVDMVRQSHLMKLRASRDDRGHRGSSNA